MTSRVAPPVLDTTGLPCPVPVLKARKALAGMAAGALLEVLASDPASPEDFKALCAATGHRLVSHRHDGEVHHFLIEVQP
jgi:tRNA 2-thiouridine synthesizing protein A